MLKELLKNAKEECLKYCCKKEPCQFYKILLKNKSGEIYLKTQWYTIYHKENYNVKNERV